MNRHQRTALDFHCRLATETMHPRFGRVLLGGMFIVNLTVNSGYQRLEMNLGGPVWHASVSPRFSPVAIVLASLWDLAEQELSGVGDAALGEWREVGGVAVHLRRRLTAGEMRAGRIAGVCDVRGTAEFGSRIERVRPYLPPVLRDIPLDQLP